MRKTFAALTAAAIAIAGTGANAESISIKYTDLNLASPEGQAALERRIDAAARKVCALGEVQTGTRIRNREARKCYDRAKSQATKQFAVVVERQAKGG